MSLILLVFAIVSTVKETGDLLRGDGFSFGDWWNQTSDNMMMGEVFGTGVLIYLVL